MRQARRRKWRADLTQGAITISAGPRLRTAMILAIVADVLQLVVFPLVVEGAMSPADDILDLSVPGVLAYLLGWHWEFLPSFLAKLMPGVEPSAASALCSVSPLQHQPSASSASS